MNGWRGGWRSWICDRLTPLWRKVDPPRDQSPPVSSLGLHTRQARCRLLASHRQRADPGRFERASEPGAVRSCAPATLRYSALIVPLKYRTIVQALTCLVACQSAVVSSYLITPCLVLLRRAPALKLNARPLSSCSIMSSHHCRILISTSYPAVSWFIVSIPAPQERTGHRTHGHMDAQTHRRCFFAWTLCFSPLTLCFSPPENCASLCLSMLDTHR
jgi:hypothetical protein